MNIKSKTVFYFGLLKVKPGIYLGSENYDYVVQFNISDAQWREKLSFGLCKYPKKGKIPPVLKFSRKPIFQLRIFIILVAAGWFIIFLLTFLVFYVIYKNVSNNLNGVTTKVGYTGIIQYIPYYMVDILTTLDHKLMTSWW